MNKTRFFVFYILLLSIAKYYSQDSSEQSIDVPKVNKIKFISKTDFFNLILEISIQFTKKFLRKSSSTCLDGSPGYFYVNLGSTYKDSRNI